MKNILFAFLLGFLLLTPRSVSAQSGAKWSCIPGVRCEQDANGFYTSLSSCEEVCLSMKPFNEWLCTGRGNCIKTPLGSVGTHPTELSCRTECTASDDLAAPPSSFAGISEGCGAPGDEISTALGCIPIFSTEALMAALFIRSVGIAGGIAFIFVLIASFQIITSQGDPKKLQAGKELITSAIGGLLLLIFSAYLLRIIGVDILGILIK